MSDLSRPGQSFFEGFNVESKRHDFLVGDSPLVMTSEQARCLWRDC